MSSSENEELRGRVIALEAIVLTLSAISSQESDDPRRFLAELLASSHGIVKQLQTSAADAFSKRVSTHALSAFEGIGKQLFDFMNRKPS